MSMTVYGLMIVMRCVGHINDCEWKLREQWDTYNIRLHNGALLRFVKDNSWDINGIIGNINGIFANHFLF
jgi:hypothetical protein